MTVRLFALILAMLLVYPVAAKTITVPLGSKNLTISVTGSGRGPTCVALHSNESTSIRAASGLCGKLIVIKNGGAREVTFSLAGQKYFFDPNRIFTAAGRRMTLRPQATAAAEKVLAAMTTAITREFGNSPLIGLHNNSNGSYSILNYQDDGAHVVPGQDPDNFVLTTSGGFYRQAKAAGYNAYLERSGPDDGSLSVYARRAGRSYLNIEAEAASGSWQRQAYQKLLP